MPRLTDAERSKFLRAFSWFCREYGINPNEVGQLPPKMARSWIRAARDSSRPLLVKTAHEICTRLRRHPKVIASPEATLQTMMFGWVQSKYLLETNVYPASLFVLPSQVIPVVSALMDVLYPVEPRNKKQRLERESTWQRLCGQLTEFGVGFVRDHLKGTGYQRRIHLVRAFREVGCSDGEIERTIRMMRRTALMQWRQASKMAKEAADGKFNDGDPLQRRRLAALGYGIRT